jgi:hypothetical protein
MATPPIAPPPNETDRVPTFGKTRLTLLIVLVVILVACLVFTWATRGAMENLSFLSSQSASSHLGTKKTLVDLTPWQTAQALSALAVTAEENEFAHDALRLADHEADQAFASALRQARLRAEHTTLTGDALALSQKITSLQQLIAQDQAQVARVTTELSAPPAHAGKNNAPPSVNADNNDDLQVAKAQLGLDTDELADAQRDLGRASGDDSTQIQQELAAHEASMRQYDKKSNNAQVAVVSEKRHGTLAGRVKAWFSQISRNQSSRRSSRLCRLRTT